MIDYEVEVEALMSESFDKAFNEIVRKREELLQKALDHFSIHEEEIKKRVSLMCHHDSSDHIYIDDEEVLILGPLYSDSENMKMKFSYKECY